MWNEVLDNLVVVKRSGQRVSFDASKLAVAIRNAFCVIYDNEEGKNVHRVFKEVLTYINDNYKDRKTINVEDIQDIIENKLSEMGYQEVFIAFKEYRQERAASRRTFNVKQQHKFVKVVERLEKESKKFDSYESPNEMLSSFGKIVSSEYAKAYILDNKFVRAIEEGKIFIHDLDSFLLGYLSNIYLKINISDDDYYLDEFLNNIINSSNEVSSEIGINNLDFMLKNFFLGFYRRNFLKELEKYFKFTGVYEFLNFKRIQEVIFNVNDIDVSISEFELFLVNSKIKEVFEIVLESTFERTKRYISDTIYRIFNTIKANNLASSIYSISIGNKENSKIGSLIREDVISYLNDNNYLDNIHVNFKVFSDSCDEYLQKLAGLVISNKNISFSFPKKNNNEVEYFSDGLTIYDNINDTVGKSNGRMFVAKTSINLGRLGLKCLNSKSFDSFYEELDQLLELAKNELLFMFENLGSRNKENYTALFHGNVLGDERLENGQKIRKILKSGVLGVGLIGLKECVLAYNQDSKKQYEFLFELLNYLNEKVKQFSIDTRLNFSIFESGSTTARKYFVELDKAIYGVHKDINEEKLYDLICNAKFLEKYEDFAKVQKLLPGGNLTVFKISKRSNNKRIIDLIKELIQSDVSFAHLKVGGK